MVSKPHRQNSDFQLRYFIAGDCKTPDGAWSILYNQKIDLENKIKHCEVQKLRRDIRILEIELVLNDKLCNKIDKLKSEADMMELNASIHLWELNYEAAKQELNTVNQIMDELEPMRKYSHLPLLEATEACQQEEWKLELMTRAENFLLSQGSIPADELRFMRNHPDFIKEIAPYIELLNNHISNQSLSLAEKLTIPSITNDK